MLKLFVLAILLRQLVNLLHCCPFRIAWWAVSFPLAASAVAALRYASAHSGWVPDVIAAALLFVSTVIIVGLTIRTAVGIARGELRALSL